MALASAPQAVAVTRIHVAADRRSTNHVGIHHHVRHQRQERRHSATRAPESARNLHIGLVPLANTTWDNPEMPPVVAGAILSAAAASDIDPHLLAALAWRESRFDPNARNHFSSATGLLQFTNSTWLRAMQLFGARHHAAAYAEQIKKDASGTLAVADKRLQTAIMRLRSDPVLSTAIAADVICEQRNAMAIRLGREVGLADLYLLHVLGVGGSSRFLAALANHPTASSQSVASRKVLRQAGLLARDGHPMTVANTFIAVERMLEDQRLHSEPLLAIQASAVPVAYDQVP